MSELIVSNLVSSQLPDFIRSDNPKFVIFLEKYYKWLESSNNALYEVKTLEQSKDLDLVDDYYLNEIAKEVLPYFPKEILLDKRTFIKNVGEFYRSKGTPESVKFLFRILYNEDIEIYFPKEQILKVSDGKWVLPLSLRVETGDTNIFDIEKCKITGTNSKATAIVEKVIKSVDRQLGIEYVELYISNINKLFLTGENVSTTIVRTNGNEDFVTAKLIGSLSEIKIDPKNRGLYYNGYDTELRYEGDPVTIIGGLNPSSGNPIGAIATVGNVLQGSVDDVVVTNGGFGFRDPALYQNSSILDFTGGFKDILLGSEAKAKILLLDEKVYRTINVSNITIESFYSSTIDGIDNVNDNKTINELTTKQTLNVFPISFITVESSGGGYKTQPDLDIYSLYMEELDDTLIINSTTAVKGTRVLRDESQDLTNSFEVGETVKLFLRNRYEEIKIVANVSSNTITFFDEFENNINNLSVYKLNRRKLTEVGSLGRIQIVNGGNGYSVGDFLVFSSTGRGYGANANVSSVHAGNNGIKTITFNETSDYIRGGESYTMIDLPTVTVNSPGGGQNAVLKVSEILGEGLNKEISTTRIGAISSIRVISYGYDYVSAPIISLRNADISLTDVTEGQIYVANTFVYQGASNTNYSWSAYVDKYSTSNNSLRVYNYTGTFDSSLSIKSDDNLTTGNVVTSLFYGDGKAKATAKFENGLIRYPGIYLNTDGQPSSDQKFQDDKKYHNFSYIINTENDYYKFKKTLQETVHPLGTKTFVTKIDTNSKNASDQNVQIIYLTQDYHSNTFNISNISNSIVSTSITPNVQSEVSVGNLIILKNLEKTINGTANISSSSNVITGNGTNFIHDVVDGQTLYLSSGNTVVVKSIFNANTIFAQTEFGISSTDLTIRVVFDETKNVSFVNANTILVDTNPITTNNFVSIIVQKVR
jgi:hypothetical protein